jgi:transcriptional regulator with XRE-family HTH domain
VEVEFYRIVIAQLIDRRMAIGLSQEGLADRIGVSDGLVSHWEAMSRLPSSFFLVLWCCALGLALDLRTIGETHGEAETRNTG